jgi:glutamine amidotransferase
MIGIIDYGAGNLLSVKKALSYLRVDCKIIKTKNDFNRVKKIILPGVGAFQSAIQRLKDTGVYGITRDWLSANKPFLGICLGMQLLFEASDESKGAAGFSVFKGKSLRFRGEKVPQIGWNQVNIQRESKLMKGIKDNSFFYFLHGYFVQPVNNNIVVGSTDYNTVYPSVIESGNIYGVQFHPEKSSNVGLKLFNNWVKIC